MRLYLFLLVAVAFPALAEAQALPRPNHTLPQFQTQSAANNNDVSLHTMSRMAVSAPRSGRYAPLWPPGGLRHDTLIPSVYTDGSSGTLAQIGQMADSSVQQAAVNAVNGVAGLDAGGNVTSPLMSETDWLGAWQSHVTDVDRFARGYEAAILGGNVMIGKNRYTPRSLLLQSDPYGPYSAGCGIGNAMTGSTYNAQMPISQRDPAGGAASVVGVGQFDVVAHCELVSNMAARMVLSVSGYTPTSVLLSAPLTAAQAAQIHPNTYITTNSPDTTLAIANDAGTLPKRNLYAGFVSMPPSAGDMSISVTAWAVPGYGSSSPGQVPQTTKLDTIWSKYLNPTVFLGGGSGSAAFAENWFFNLDANDLSPSSSTHSLVHQFTPLEIDLNIVNGTAPANSVWWQGINMNAGNQPAALTSDSRQIFLGGNINHHLVVGGGCGNWDYETTSGGGYVAIPTPCNLATGGITTQVVQSWSEWIGSANRLTMMLYNSIGNSSAPTGWQQAVTHFGPTIDGTTTQTGDYGGSKQGDIEWNAGGAYGSISLCGYAQNCGMLVNGDGSVAFSKSVSFSGSEGALVVPSGTPASSKYPCRKGQIEIDQSYIYTCVATNSWHRVSNGSAW